MGRDLRIMGQKAPLNAPFHMIGSPDRCSNPPFKLESRTESRTYFCLNTPTRYFVWKLLTGPNRNKYFASAYCENHASTPFTLDSSQKYAQWEISEDDLIVLRVMKS